ncbi:hypothetical protein [Acuticoccus sp.]|uniref:hypothetical protein n=1 Tax=Acuticoccus sp. TaxID=1904378 RepID=UPI003B51891B
MTVGHAQAAFDRHILVTQLWFAFGFVALTLWALGYAGGEDVPRVPFILAGFTVVVLGFAVHVLVNVATGIAFSSRELILGLVLYAGALIAFALTTLTVPSFRDEAFAPTFVGLAAMFVAVLSSLVIAFGLRRTFAAFDAIRSSRA